MKNSETKLKKSKPVFKWYSFVQMIGLLGIIFMIVNLFIHLVPNYWWIVVLVLYIVGMIFGTTVSKEVILPPEKLN